MLTVKQGFPFGSEGQAGTKLPGRLWKCPFCSPHASGSCTGHSPEQCRVFQVPEQCTVFSRCALEVPGKCCAPEQCVHPPCASSKFPCEISPSPGTGSPRDVTCLVFLGRNTPCFIVSMHKKLAKCTASSMIRFLFHRATVIYEAYFHVVTRKCFHLMIRQCTFLYQTCLKTFYCFKNIFSQEFCCFNQISF